MVHIISVRETSANPGPGMMQNVSNSIAEKILHPDPQAVDYPATWDNPPYSISEGQGVNETRRMLEEYTSTCPNSDIVLLGYSQVSLLLYYIPPVYAKLVWLSMKGAQVVADVLCGTSESGFHPSSPLPWGIGQSVKAAILMGDPSHRQTAPYNFNHTGSGNLDGVSAFVFSYPSP
ncbi:Alpha/Beta hydrolase protein [Aspergillus alliaceus]|uniref:Alpha/Beta hydrolase protein n=1 Tax=Petromyces alliaceus TaxID=209559 RepID=A0A5N7BV81_PETAA|nr:Alpha/Beta hydrolase protein [Aspergillus alliaceus]